MIEAVYDFDWNVFKFIEENFWCPALDAFFKVITSLGNAGIVWIIIAVALMITKKYRKYGFMMACGLVIMLVTNNLFLKNLIARPRPYDTVGVPDWYVFPEIVERETSYSFPSGHASSSFVGIIPIFMANKHWGPWALLLAALIAFSRIYVHIHFCSDVIAGAVCGLIYGLIGCIVGGLIYNKLYPIITKKLESRKKAKAAAQESAE